MGGAIKAVFLDIGGTVLETNESSHEVYAEILKWHGYDVTIDEAKGWLDAARVEARRLPTGRGDGFTIVAEHERARRDLMIESFLRRAGVGNGFNALLEAIHQSWVGTKVFPIYPDSAQALRALREAGLIVGAVSNWESRLPDLLASHGIRDCFDFVISSEAVGYVKPGPRLFELALERAGVTPDQALYVGDDPELDVSVPEALGIRSVYVRRRPGAVVEHAPTITSLVPLAGLARAEALIRGYVESGKGEAAGFTQLGWARQQISDQLAFDPFPGTLNLRISEARDLADWDFIRQQAGLPLEPTPGYCAGRCYPALVEGSVPCAIILPSVAGYPVDTVEVIAPLSLRDNLGLHDGSWVSLAVGGAQTPV